MTLTQLAYFVRIAELESFSKAAAVVRIAQPALSRQIRNLEAELGAELFERQAWGVRLTEAGGALLEHAREILLGVDAARDAVDALSAEPAGRVSIGVPATLATQLLPPLALALRSAYPRLKPRFVDDFSTGLHARVHAGELDLAILYEDKAMGPLVTAPLLQEPLTVVVQPGGASTAAEILRSTTVVLSGRPSLLRKIIDGVLAIHGVTDSAILEVDSLPAIVSMVSQGLGCTVLPYSTVADEVDRDELQALPLSPAPTRALVLARPLDRSMTTATAVTEARIRTIVAELAPRFAWTTPGRRAP